MTDITQLTMFKQRDVEKLFAACVYSNPLEAIQLCGWLQPNMLMDDRIRRYWSTVLDRIRPEMAGTDKATSEIINITMEHDLTLDVTGWASQTFLYSALPYANEISRRNYLTMLSTRIGDLVKSIQQGDDSAAREIVRNLGEMDIQRQSTIPVAFDVAETFDKVVTDGLRSVETFIPSIDNATGGLERQTLSIIAARPSIGKTALAWQIARAAAYNGRLVLFFSLEMSAVNLWGRAACPTIGTTWRDVRAGKLNANQKENLLAESYKMAANFEERLRIVDTPQTTDTIWQTVAQLRPDLVIVDHLRLVKDQAPSEVKRLGQITQRLKDLSKNFGCAVLLLAQLNRQTEMRSEKRPILADLRDSGEIEENADLVLMMHREEAQTDTKPQKSLTEVWVRKFRDGPRDVLIRLWFDPKQEWFEGSSI